MIALRAVQDPLASTKHLALFFFFPKELKNFHCFLGRDAAAGSRVLWKSRWVILVTEVFLEVMMPKKYLSGDKSSFWGHHQGGQSDLLIYLFFEPSAPPPKVGAPNLGAGSVLGFLLQKLLRGMIGKHSSGRHLEMSVTKTMFWFNKGSLTRTACISCFKYLYGLIRLMIPFRRRKVNL